MAKTPDELLADVRRAVEQGFGGPGWLAAFAELDALLSSGGPLPSDWRFADERPQPAADDVPLPGGHVYVGRRRRETA